MSWLLQALAQLLGCEPAPGTPAHRDAYFRSCKLLNEARKQPAAQKDAAWMLEEAKRCLRLGVEFNMAEAQALRRDAKVWVQCFAAWQAEQASPCCLDFARVCQRKVASLQARAALHEAWARVKAERRQALQEGRPPPPAPRPRLELQLPAGLPQELPTSIDRCAACQNQLEKAMYQERRLQARQEADTEYPFLLEIFVQSRARHGSGAGGGAA